MRIVLADPGITLDEARRRLDEFEAGKGRTPIDQALFDELVAALSSEGFFTFDEATNTLRS